MIKNAYSYRSAKRQAYIAIIAWSALMAQYSYGQCQYEATIIQGPICPDGFPASFSPQALDEQGNAGGGMTCFIAPTAGVWTFSTMSGQMLPSTGESTVFGMTDPDHLVGVNFPAGQNFDVAAYWKFEQLQIIGTLPGDVTSKAHGINTSEQVVGQSSGGPSGLRAFLWENDEFSALNLPIGPQSLAGDINESGQITGWMGDGFLNNAFIWDNGNVTTIPVIPNGQASLGSAINSLGHVVGMGALDVPSIGLTRHAFFWDGQAMIDLGTLPDHKRSRAEDINDLDQIVGASSFVGDEINVSHAVLWQDGQMHTIQDLVVTDLGGFVLIFATSINNDGQILAVANGIGVLLTPIGSAPGDIDNNCVVNVNDLLLLFGEWGKADSFADVNEDGTVNVNDLLDLLGDWG